MTDFKEDNILTAIFPATVEVITFVEAHAFIEDNMIYDQYDVESLTIYRVTNSKGENFILTISPIDPCLRIKIN